MPKTSTSSQAAIGNPFQVQIPDIGDRLRLVQPWEFRLVWERRNEKFAENIGVLEYSEDGWDATKWNGIEVGSNQRRYSDESMYASLEHAARVTIPAGSILNVDRIYIRKGISDYSSVTFTLKKGNCVDKTMHGRFWAKLADVNEMVAEFVGNDAKAKLPNYEPAVGRLSAMRG